MSYTKRLWISFGPAALAVGALDTVVVLTSHHASARGAAVALTLLIGWSFAGAGLAAWSRRPDNATGRLLVAVGFVWFLSPLGSSNNAWVFSTASLLGSLVLGVFVHLLLAFPTGRLEARRIRLLVASAYGAALLANVTLALVTRPEDTGCKGCPPNKLLLTHTQALSDGVTAFWDVVGAVLTISVAVVLFRRWRAGSAPLRRILRPVFASGGLTLLLIGIGFAVDPASHDVGGGIQLIGFVTFASVPWFFLWGLMRVRLARGDVGRLLAEIPDSGGPADVRDALRVALRDPSLRLVHWLGDRDTYVTVDGSEFTPPPDAAVTTIDAEGVRLGALVHDPSLLQEPELLNAAAASARVALQKHQLEAELRARVHDLERSEERNRVLVQAIPDMMFRLRSDGVILDFHAHDRDELVQPREERRGLNLWALSNREAAERMMRCAQRALETGELQTVEYESRGAIREARMLPSGPDEVVIISRDITEQKRAEDELRTSRARIIEATASERRRLERNLHDGAQQRLVSLSLALRLAQARLKTDPDGASGVLDAAATELAQALEELRELARGIHPAILTDRGLAAALEALANRAPLPVDLAELPDDRLPEPVEAAAYYVVSEGLANVAKYANASAVTVRVARRNGSALVEVADDGVGGADPALGSGLRGLADRVEALDGRLEVSSEPGAGTTLRARIPCARS